MIVVADAGAVLHLHRLRARSTAIGTIGLNVEASRSGRAPRDEAARALEALPTRGRLHVSRELLVRAIAALSVP